MIVVHRFQLVQHPKVSTAQILHQDQRFTCFSIEVSVVTLGNTEESVLLSDPLAPLKLKQRRKQLRIEENLPLKQLVRVELSAPLRILGWDLAEQLLRTITFA
uniref:(northern house mosquito) hypothetical protein n=1 Tax=Culex pipiens TaxID=7175 RepID=A0A8D8ERX5_CULPI